MRRQKFNSNAAGRSIGLPKGTENRTVSSLYISWAVLPSSNFSHCSSALSCNSPALLQLFSKKLESLGSHLKSEAEIARSLHQFFKNILATFYYYYY